MDINEIRLRVANHLEPSDLFACTLVSKGWYSVFIRELYRNIKFFPSDRWEFPRHGTLLQLVASLYRFRTCINSIHMELLAVQIDRLLFRLENYSQVQGPTSVDPTLITTTSTTKEETLGKSRTPLFPNMESLYLNVYDDQGAELSWLVHCPSLRSLRLFVPNRDWFRKTVPLKAVLPLTEILALPLWSTTLTHLKISGGVQNYALEVPILHQCKVLTGLTISPQESNMKVLEGFRESLRHLDMTERTAFPWVMQNVLGNMNDLEKLSIFAFKVRPMMGVDWAREMPLFEVAEREWACVGLKRLHITCLEWSSKPNLNTDLLTQ